MSRVSAQGFHKRIINVYYEDHEDAFYCHYTQLTFSSLAFILSTWFECLCSAEYDTSPRNCSCVVSPVLWKISVKAMSSYNWCSISTFEYYKKKFFMDVGLLFWTCRCDGERPSIQTSRGKQPSQVACVSQDLECWGTWDITCWGKAKHITRSIAWRREV